MLRGLLKVVLVLFAGPLLAIGTLSLGCLGSDPPLGMVCGHNAPLSFVALTLGAWLVIVVVLSIRSAKRQLF
jgi:hypothetical protein